MDVSVARAEGPPAPQASSPARPEDDPLTPYRDRFRQGMEKYRAGAMAEAIRAWSAIYEEIGPQRGYRLSFNLARAYEANFETSRAAERYQSFLDEVAVRRRAGEGLDPIVDREATEAQKRIDELNASNGRIRIVSDGRGLMAQIDGADPRLGSFVTYVAPGDHVVVLSPGSPDQERREVAVKAGELATIVPSPPAEPAPPPRPPPVATPPAPRRLELQRPFPPAVLYVGAAVTAASLAVPIVFYARALSLSDSYYASAAVYEKNILRPEYYSARTTAYGTLAVPLAFTAVTGALLGYYLAGAKERDVTVGVTPEPGGAAVAVVGRF